MKTQIKHISETQKKLSVEVPAETVAHCFEHAYAHVRKKVNIKGFRQGKAPDYVLDQMYGGDVAYEALNHLIEETYPKAIDEHKLTPVLRPKFDLKPVEKKNAYSYCVEVEVKPPLEIKDYKGVALKKRDIVIEGWAIEQELKNLQESRAELKPAEDSAVLGEGLVATLDFEGTLEGKPFKGGSAQGYQMEYGKGRLLKEFEEKIAGMKKGEERLIEITYPADYFDAQFQGKTGRFRVALHALYLKELPQIDDEFAKDMGKENIETVKKEIEETLKKRRSQELKNEYAKEALDYLWKKNPLEIPAGLLKQEMEGSRTGIEEAQKSIAGRFILEAIAQKESIQVEPKDIESRLQYFSYLTRRPLAELKKHYSDPNNLSSLAHQILLEKTLDFVVGNATLK